MIIRIFCFLIGFGFSVIGGSHIIGYLNLLVAGKSFIEYLLFITGRFECYLFIFGILFMFLSLHYASY